MQLCISYAPRPPKNAISIGNATVSDQTKNGTMSATITIAVITLVFIMLSHTPP